MMGKSMLALAFVLIVALTGCAGTVTKGLLLPSLTVSEQAEAAKLEQAMALVKEDCVYQARLSGASLSYCQWIAPHVVVVRNGATPRYQNGYTKIEIPRSLLINHPVAHAVLSHELSHAWFSDARDDCRDVQKIVLCEQAANRWAVRVLQVGYGYSHGQAIAAVRAYLVRAVVQKAQPSRGHPDACAETHAFELWAGVTPLYPCQEEG